MASRRDSLEKLDKRLKALAKKLPEENEQFTYLFRLLEPEKFPDLAERATAIVGTQFVEFALQKAIATHFKGTPHEKEVFDAPGAPLGTLSAKITLASALGIINREEREDLDTIRIVRNAFAHAATHISWADEEVSNLCNALHGYGPTYLTPVTRQALGPRKLYLSVVSLIYWKLFTYLGPEAWRPFGLGEALHDALRDIPE